MSDARERKTANEANFPKRGKARTGSNFRQNIVFFETVVTIFGYLHLLTQTSLTSSAPFGAHPTIRFCLMAIFGVVYILRVNVMVRHLLPREVSNEELGFVLLIFVPVVMASFAFAANGCDGDINITLAIVSVCLYLLGSYLNSGSELQRKRWKSKSENKGKCYTEGLFSLARNINYFGDVILFFAWALASGRWWNAWVPLFMFAMFVLYHIPEKEKYLAKRYPNEWPSYYAKTKKLIPFIY